MSSVATSGRIRKDPKPRHVSGQAHTFDGSPGWTRLLNKRADRVYKMVYKGGGDLNQVPKYLEMGYIVEQWGEAKDSLRFAAGITGKIGEEMEHQGHVVMSIDAEEHARIESEGDGFSFGQRHADRIEAAIRRGTGVANPTRGRVARIGAAGIELGRSLSTNQERYEEVADSEEE